MKLKIITALTLVLSLNIYSQETIKRKDYYENSEQIYSQFYVLKNDTSIKHGQIIFYKQIEESDYKFFKGDNQERLISTKGQFEMNKKIGRWEFFMDKNYTFDFDKKELLSLKRYISYPVFAQECGIEGDVIIQYDIDSLFNYKNIEGISGDSILMKIVIRDIKKFSKTRADILTKISVVIEDCSQENVKDTIRFRLQ